MKTRRPAGPRFAFQTPIQTYARHREHICKIAQQVTKDDQALDPDAMPFEFRIELRLNKVRLNFYTTRHRDIMADIINTLEKPHEVRP